MQQQRRAPKSTQFTETIERWPRETDGRLYHRLGRRRQVVAYGPPTGRSHLTLNGVVINHTERKADALPRTNNAHPSPAELTTLVAFARL
jgi:hypothetical protein